MFTGIIEEIGKIIKIESIAGGKKLKILMDRISDDIKIDDSIAVNGVCLTITGIDKSGVWLDIVGETLEKTTLASMREGGSVNLERALRLSDRLGGHLVQGHVNGVGEITQISKRGENYYLEIFLPPDLIRYVVNEGSITVDGISLTIARIENMRIGISIIPHTWQHTMLSNARVGQKVNIETDVLAKYVEKILNNFREEDKYSKEWFQELGY